LLSAARRGAERRKSAPRGLAWSPAALALFVQIILVDYARTKM